MPTPTLVPPRAATAALALALAFAAIAAGPARAAGTTERASVGPGGRQADDESFRPALPSTGRFVAFESEAATLVRGDTNGWQDVFVRDRRTGTTTRASVGPGGVQGDERNSSPALSADGRVVGFYSFAGNLVPRDTNATSDIFVVRTR